jgi:arabinose-5-phosphate isomerase
VQDLSVHNQQPRVLPEAPLKQVIVEITKNRLGATAVIDEQNKLLGIITDGDLRRMLENSERLDNITASKIVSYNPKTITPDELAVNALEILRKHDISQLIVTTEEGEYKGMLHIHDLVREGIV